MILTAACALMAFIIAGCVTYAATALGRGHHDGPGRYGCLRRSAGVRVLIIATLAAICAVRAGRTLRHPARHARCLAARAIRRIPGRPGDGDGLDPDEARAFVAICRGWKQDARPERSRT